MKRPKMTTAADIKIHQQVTKAHAAKANEKEFNSLRKIWIRYSKHPTLKHALDKELGKSFFHKVPSTLEGLKTSLGDIRSVFANRRIPEAVFQGVIFGASTLEALAEGIDPSHERINLRGFSANVGANWDTEMAAEIECEYGSMLEATLTSRFCMQMINIAQQTNNRNKGLSAPVPETMGDKQV